MKKLLKIIVGLLVVVVVLVVAAVVIVPMVVTPNDYKPQIIEMVKQQTGRDLAIEGDIGLSVFPKIGLNLGRTSLSNAAGFGQQAFASVQAVNIQVALLPLLDKKVEMDEVVLQGLSLNLQRNPAGKTNWQDLMAKPAEKTTEKSGEAPQLESLVIGGVRIENANILWQDSQQGQRYEIKAFNLITGPLATGDPVDIELNTTFLSAAPKVEGKFALAGIIQADAAGSQYTISDLRVSLDANGASLPGGKAVLSVEAGQLSVNLKQQTLSLASLNVDTLGVNLKGAMSGKAIMGDAPQFSGKLSIADFNARELIKALGQPAPDLADASALTHVSASFDLAATNHSANLQNLQARMDDTQLTGALAITDFSRQSITFDLNIDQIDLDRYLPVGTAAASDKTAASSTGGAEAGLFPLEMLRKLDATGIARIGLLKKMNLKVSDIVVKVKAQNGRLNMQPSATLYEGKYDADVTVDASRSTPTLTVEANLQGVQIEPLLKDLQGKARMAGTTNARVNITAAGNTQSAIKKTLNGNASFSFVDGALVGVNIAKIIRDGMAKLEGKTAKQTNEPEKTDFSKLSGTAKIKNGVVNNSDLNMQSPLLRVTGAGKANLVKENLDYLLKTSIVGSLQGQGGEDLKALKGLTIPVRITGPFSDPSYKPDLSAMLSDKVKQKVEKKKEEVKDRLKDKLKNKLKGLF